LPSTFLGHGEGPIGIKLKGQRFLFVFPCPGDYRRVLAVVLGENRGYRQRRCHNPKYRQDKSLFHLYFSCKSIFHNANCIICHIRRSLLPFPMYDRGEDGNDSEKHGRDKAIKHH
jgi:hypothetical protein